MDLFQSENLLGKLDDLITKTERIYTRNEGRKDMIAISALNSQRSALELLMKLASELRKAKEISGRFPNYDEEKLIQKGLERLNDFEKEVYFRILQKMLGDPVVSIIPG